MTTTTMDTAAQLPVVHTKPESSVSVWFTHSLLQCKRLLMVWLRDPATTIQIIAYPAVTLLMFRIVLGNYITAYSGMPAIYGQAALLTLIAAMTGAVVSALGFKREKATGLLSRFYTMPVNKASLLTGRLLAEMLRILITTVIVLLVAVPLGFLFMENPLTNIALICVPVLFGIGFAVMVTALATITEGVMLISLIGILNTLLMFFNTGFVPIAAYPTWLQAIVENQPMSCAIEAMKGLSYGGPVAEPLLKTVAWTVAMIAVFAYPAIRGYKRAAETA
ncbi:peptide ABC transporter permease [Nocardia mangyaensis]|uniref:Transport permease protein n=1 Tax=Nocardia mangyaensis TaxID=2213200 RepID=A0A1J0W156_9NOCA|nr:ABC transporter permease [Nocardia mangyaensis]APE37997.1 peptide ABC transporter permease [Nocardia mangyaensis]MDO3647359.1 ABC transporter permease [Nocardia mangyaensis]